VGFAKITRDITERREAQLALQEAQTQRAHAQKMDALGQLTGGVAHDFNNMLMVVNGHVHVLKARMGEDPRVARSIEAIEAAARQGSTLTRQLLAFSRRQPIAPSVIEPGRHIEAVRSMLTGVLPGSIALTVSIAADIWPIKVDAGELELTLVNLFLNARDAMPKGGTLSLTAENVILSRDDTAAEIEGEFAGLRLTDTGTGIPPDILDRIFEPFFTTKPLDKGTGLGLSQVYGFAHQSGGTVTVDSVLGQGTAVTLYLPRTHESATESPPADMTAPAAGGSILLVEDNPEVAEITATMLEQSGYQVAQASNADAALDLVEKAEFDLVLSDITMPGHHDGLALARLLRRLRPRLPVLLVTGYSSRAIEAAKEFVVLRKPFQFHQLNQAVVQALHGRSTASAARR
ncbi:MAG TPA: response regulator, partial [Magnetospirillaceae bacterium]|nr:response regulator [Magnetospirillaceae bacterium]